MYESLFNQIYSRETIRNHFGGFTIRYNRVKNTYVLGNEFKNDVPFHSRCVTLKELLTAQRLMRFPQFVFLKIALDGRDSSSFAKHNQLKELMSLRVNPIIHKKFLLLLRSKNGVFWMISCKMTFNVNLSTYCKRIVPYCE